MKIFGREPALWIALVTSVVTVLAALNLDFLSAGQAAAISAAVGTVIIAVTTRPVAPALFTAVVTVGSALLTEYGLDLSPALVAAVTVVVLNACALLGIRPQVSPKETAVSSG